LNCAFIIVDVAVDLANHVHNNSHTPEKCFFLSFTLLLTAVLFAYCILPFIKN